MLGERYQQSTHSYMMPTVRELPRPSVDLGLPVSMEFKTAGERQAAQAAAAQVAGPMALSQELKAA